MSKTKKNVVIAIAIMLLVVAVSIFVLLSTPFGNNIKKAIGIASPVPTFAFDKSVAGGWWAADNYNSKENVTDDYKGGEPKEKLPVASRIIFQSKDTTVDSCFVMYSYYDYVVDTEALLKEKENYSANTTKVTLNKLNSEELSIHTPEGVKSYQLHHYSISGPGSEQMQRGMSLGYVKLSGGYIAINGICPEGDQMGKALDGMKGISLI